MSNSSSDPDFVVADGDLSEELTDSDSGSSPRLSLMDRIQRKAATEKKKKLASGSSEENSKTCDAASGKKKPLVKDPKGRSKSNKSKKGSELTGGDVSSGEDDPVSKGKKKTLVIESSESETEFDHIRRLETPGRKAIEKRREPAVVISSDDDSGDGFVNIYSPKYYGEVPPPDPKEVSKRSVVEPKPKSKPKVVRGSKVSPTSFKTPVRPKAVSSLAARDAPDTPTLTFLSSLTQVHGRHNLGLSVDVQCFSTQDTPAHRCHPEALRYTQGKRFAKSKEELARRLHELYNREIFGAALPHDMPIGEIN